MVANFTVKLLLFALSARAKRRHGDYAGRPRSERGVANAKASSWFLGDRAQRGEPKPGVGEM